MVVLVTGSTGLLGSQVVDALALERFETVGGVRSLPQSSKDTIHLDLFAPSSIEKALTTLKPDAVVHAAAMTNVDYCELHPVEAHKVNGEATASLARLSRRMGAYLIYVSTDYVFDGERGMYREEDATSPVNVYGRTKLEGEIAVAEEDGHSATVRASVIYGPTPASDKVNFAVWLVDSLRRGQRVRIVRWWRSE